jgi:putative flavoprotein involved in K+ transport
VTNEEGAHRVRTIVIGGGQAGLSVGYHLARRGLEFIILESHQRVGDSWRRRWDSLRLFTPARFDGLVGMPFPAPPDSFPTKDEMADYLEAYATRFKLPVQTGVTVDRLSRHGRVYEVSAGNRQFEAERVVVAMSDYQRCRLPSFARELDPAIVQLHSADYRNLSQFRPGGVLVVGAGNSGADIALEAARGGHRTWMSGRDVGHLPFRIDGLPSRLLLARLMLRGAFHRVLTVNTSIGRKLRRKILSMGGPLIRVRPKDFETAGVERVPRTVGVLNGRPVLEDQRVLDVANIVWCTGFHPGFSSWIDLPIFGSDGRPIQERGVIVNQPGLYFVGLIFLYAASSVMIHGVGRDAEYIAETILRSPPQRTRSTPRNVCAAPSAPSAESVLDGLAESQPRLASFEASTPGPQS